MTLPAYAIPISIVYVAAGVFAIILAAVSIGLYLRRQDEK